VHGLQHRVRVSTYYVGTKNIFSTLFGVDNLLFVALFMLEQSAHYAVIHFFGERPNFFFGHFRRRFIRLHINTRIAVTFTHYSSFHRTWRYHRLEIGW